jgi:hypothetical protein
VSLGEDGLSGVLSFTAVIWPLVAFFIVLALAAAAVALVRRWRALGIADRRVRLRVPEGRYAPVGSDLSGRPASV